MKLPSLRCENLVVSFGGVRALNAISYDFPTGVTALIGPNGAGKTTLLNVLSGFVRPDAGRWILGDRPLGRLPPHAIARLGIGRTFQELRLIRETTVLSNVMLAFPDQLGERVATAVLRGRRSTQERALKDKAREILSFVTLSEDEGLPAGSLSYGQQKLLALACVLASSAHTLLLDEPVSGVHPALAERILDRLAQLREDGYRVIIVEHDFAAVRAVADSVVLLDRGSIRTTGSVGEVLDGQDLLDAYVR